MCISSVNYTFSSSGRRFGSISPSRGLRQGDPLSPYLFILCAQGLSAALTTHEHLNYIYGCVVARNAPSISHLFFADDNLLFFRSNLSKCQQIKDCWLTREHMVR